MSKTSPQNFKNHGRFRSAVSSGSWHYPGSQPFYMAGLYAYKNFNLFTGWIVIMSIAIWIPVPQKYVLTP